MEYCFERDHPPRSCTNFSMVRITEVLIFLIVFDLLFQMQGKSRQSISKKGRNTRFLKIVKLDQPGRYDLFCLSIDEIFLENLGLISKKISKNLGLIFQLIEISSWLSSWRKWNYQYHNRIEIFRRIKMLINDVSVIRDDFFGYLR